MKCVIIDGQGGKMGRMVIEGLKQRAFTGEIYAIGTNSIATATMLKAGADHGATGENPVVRNVVNADLIIGPIGIVVANAILGEVTPRMAEAVGSSFAHKILLPTSGCQVTVAGTRSLPLSEVVSCTIEEAMQFASGAGK